MCNFVCKFTKIYLKYIVIQFHGLLIKMKEIKYLFTMTESLMLVKKFPTKMLHTDTVGNLELVKG